MKLSFRVKSNDIFSNDSDCGVFLFVGSFLNLSSPCRTDNEFEFFTTAERAVLAGILSGEGENLLLDPKNSSEDSVCAWEAARVSVLNMDLLRDSST
jgi:hypothetical protein